MTNMEGQPENKTKLEGRAISPEEMQSALFGQLVLQQANMATMLLGKIPHPDTGKTEKDLEAARFFIDQLEMLEAKTKGNLTREESGLLKQSLMALRLGYVEAADEEKAGVSPSKGAERPEQPSGTGGSVPAQGGAGEKGTESPQSGEEHRPKFSKKY